MSFGEKRIEPINPITNLRWYNYGTRFIETTVVSGLFGDPIINIVTYNDRYELHGPRIYEHANESLIEIFYHGVIHSTTEAAWRILRNNEIREKKYYIGGCSCPKIVFEEKQRKAIKDLLPQPIAEEILEYYSLD